MSVMLIIIMLSAYGLGHDDEVSLDMLVCSTHTHTRAKADYHTTLGS